MKSKNINILAWGSVVAAASLASSAMGAAPVVKVVPFAPQNPLVAHETWAGKVITLKGTCDQEGSAFAWTWDFGDGSSVSGTVGNKYVVEAKHAYSGPVNTIYTARLTIRNTNTGEEAAMPYYVAVKSQSLKTEANVAIDEGLWYLHKTQHRSGESGDWYSGSGYATLAAYGCTVANINAFEVNGHLESGDSSNPYVETVRRGMRSLFSWLTSIGIGMQAGGNPDANGNGIGITPSGSYPYYQGGMFIDAIVASRTPAAVAQTGPANVMGRTYKEIVQDMVDAYSWAQYDGSSSGYLLGGWRYSANEWPDNSACQWAAIGLIAAERTWGCTIPAWVKARNIPWLVYSQAANGSFGYTTSSPVWGPYATTPSGMVQMIMDGIGRGVADPGYPNWDKAETFMRDTFGNTGDSYNAVKKYYYGLFSFVKSMLLHQGADNQPIVMLHSQTAGVSDLDWYAAEVALGAPTDGVARTLVRDQAADGYWYGHNVDGSQMRFETAWAIMMLRQSIDVIRPIAVAKAVPNPCVAGQLVTLDGTDSYHPDPGKSVVAWEWDVDGKGDFEASGPVIKVTFSDLGKYPIRLRVHDDAVPSQTGDTTVDVEVNTPPIAPTADANGPYHFCDALSKWYVDGRNSRNPDEGEKEVDCAGCPGDTIKEYAWDLDGDNDFNDAFGPTPDIKPFLTDHSMGVGGYVISLRVTDDTAANYPSSGLPDQTSIASAAVYVDADCECITLTATPALKAILLAWNAYPGASYYRVYRSTVSGGPYDYIGATADLTYKDMAPGPLDQTYYYIVRPAELNGDELCQSNEASAQPLRPGPVASCTPVKLTNTAKYYYKLDASSETFGHMQLLLFVRDTATGQIVENIPPTSIVYLRTRLAAHSERAGAGTIYRYIMCKGSAEIWATDPLGQASEIITIP